MMISKKKKISMVMFLGFFNKKYHHSFQIISKDNDGKVEMCIPKDCQSSCTSETNIISLLFGIKKTLGVNHFSNYRYFLLRKDKKVKI